MVTFRGVARMVDATAMMGVLGWGGGDAVACVRTAWTQLKVKEEKYVVRQTTCVIANMLETMILMMMMIHDGHDDDDDDDDA